MPANPLQCIYCRGVFMPASKQAWSAVQCPHCSGQMKVGDCTVMERPPVGVPQPYVRVTEEEERAARAEWKSNRWAGKLVVLGSLGLVVAAVSLAAVTWTSYTKQPEKSKTPEAPVNVAAQQIEELWPGTTALAEKFLTSPQWRDVLPVVLDAARVEGVMTWFYTRHEFKPVAGPVKVLQFQRTEAEGRELLRVEVQPSTGRPVWLLLAYEKSAWKVDWEVFVNANTERWAAFLREPAGTVIELPLLVARKPAPVGYIVKAGASPDTHEAVELWATDRKVRAGMVLAKDAAGWRDLEGIGFNDAVKVIARVKLENPALDPPLVKVERILQRGWVRTAP